jgi:glutamyl-tRNA reductase
MIHHQHIDFKELSLEEREAYFKEFESLSNRNSVVLSTCNRIEIYSGEGMVDRNTVLHLFELVSGLRSKLLGETAILGQIKEAYRKACAEQILSKELHRLFQQALHVGKKVRSSTSISKGAMSYSQAVVQLLINHFADISGKTIVLLGANAMNADIMQFLTRKGVRTFLIGNRSYDKAQQLAQKFNAQAFHLSELSHNLASSDILISATSAPHAIVQPHHIPSSRKLVIFDLAVPRDIAPEVSDIENITLFNLESIEEKIAASIFSRSSEIDKVKSIVNEEIMKFIDWQNKSYEQSQLHDKNSFAA